MTATANIVRRLACIAVVASVAAFAVARGAAAQEAVTVFAAASLTDAVEQVANAYAQRGGGPVRISFASSSTLARQIEAGAPADIFLSASEAWMDYLVERKLIEASSRISPISNRLVLVAPANSARERVEVAPALDIAALLGPGGRLALGDPAHVPAGIYAKQALDRLGLWAAAEPRLALADHARAALALVARGEAPLGVVYATDAAISGDVKVIGVFPEAAHPRITYAFAIVAGPARPEVARFFAFLTGNQGLGIFERHGFLRD